MGLFSSRMAKQQSVAEKPEDPPRYSDARTLTPEDQRDITSNVQLHRATRTRKIFCILAAVLLFISVIFVIMVEIGNTFNKPVLKEIWFININLTNVVPLSYPDAALLNSIAQTLGLHDFYQVGLWGYCEGYNADGVTECTKPQTLYWFDPVSIIESQLISGASIDLPTEIDDLLDLIKLVSNWMFGLFLSGACLTAAMIPFQLLSIYSRWNAFLITVFTFLAALLITVGSVIATILFLIFRKAITSQTTLDIGAEIGVTMFALMWTASAMGIFAFIIQLCLMCCCASRRDVKRGKKHGSKKAYENTASV